ncbi:MAG: DUF2779 domain-containing protein [Endomicrobium sp.]|nr:DUF2779 domain-containing protein [Endomicrobium sp.]
MAKRSMLPRLNKGLNNKLLALELKNIHKILWQLFPNAINAKTFKTYNLSLDIKDLVLSSAIETIFEAAFVADGCYAKVDMLQRLEGNAWHLFEVKLGNKYKTKYVNDISFNTMVLAKSGVNVCKATILHLSNDYRLGMDILQFFKKLDCTEKVELKVQEFLTIVGKAFEDIESENMPKPYLKKSCKNCPVFDNCMGKDIKNHIFDLPRLSISAIDKLVALGVDTIEKVPGDFKLTAMQKIVKNCVLANTTYISENLKTEVENIKQPFYYLDFESVTTIMPLYSGIAPHTQLLTQFSLDKTDSLGNILNHCEYIADQTRDCRREIVEKLIEYLGENGSIITYANAERIFISSLAFFFPDLSEQLNKVIGRITDLELIVRKNYYSINFHGRSSIKKVLPVLIPEMSYTDLEICDGGDAAAAFAFMAMGFYDDKKIKETKMNLLQYCARDTLAMIRIHQFLINVVSQNV